MNYLTKNIFLILILSLSFYNCSSDDMNGNSTPQTENLRLVAYSIDLLEYTVSYNDDGRIMNYTNDTVYPGNIIYNADNRVIQCGEIGYTYNAQGRISGITEPDRYPYGNKESTLVYNNAGLIATQSYIFSYIPTGITKSGNKVYEYNSINQLVSISEYVPADSFYSRRLLTYDSNDNVIQVNGQTSSDGINYSDGVIINYTYDNKLNPGYLALNNINETSNFSSIHMDWLDTMYLGRYIFFGLVNYGNNNITSRQRIVISTGEIDTSTYDYVYNDEDYPTSAEINITYGDAPSITDYKTWTYETY